MNDGLLVDPERLEAQRGEVVLVDCSWTETYERAHIPGAVGYPFGTHPYLKDPRDPVHVLPPGGFADLMGRMGIGNETAVVAYDSVRGALAARLWWALGYHGHDDVRVLDGGFPRWRREGRPVAFEVEPPPRPTSFVPRVRRERIATLEQVRDGGLALLDARSRAEWEGTDRQWNRRGGHVPGAVHVEWSDAMTEDARFRPTEELRALFADLPEGDAAAYCQACVRGAHGVLALALAGRTARAYDGSMAEWANRDDTPLE